MELMPEELDALERTCNSGTETWIGAVRRDTMVALLAAVRDRDLLRDAIRSVLYDDAKYPQLRLHSHTRDILQRAAVDAAGAMGGGE